MIISLLAKFYIISLENNIDIWLESHRKRAKGHVGFWGHHSNMDYLVTIKTIVKKYINNNN